MIFIRLIAVCILQNGDCRSYFLDWKEEKRREEKKGKRPRCDLADAAEAELRFLDHCLAVLARQADADRRGTAWLALLPFRGAVASQRLDLPLDILALIAELALLPSRAERGGRGTPCSCSKFASPTGRRSWTAENIRMGFHVIQVSDR